MEQRKSPVAAEQITDDGLRDWKLAVTSIMRVTGTEMLTRQSLGIETEMVKVCPRLAQAKYRVGTEEGADIVVRNDVMVEVGESTYTLPAEHIVVVSELLRADGPLGLAHLTELLEVSWRSQTWARYTAQRVLDELLKLWGSDVLVAYEYEEGQGLQYSLNEHLTIFDARYPSATPPIVRPVAIGSQAVVAPPPLVRSAPMAAQAVHGAAQPWVEVPVKEETESDAVEKEIVTEPPQSVLEEEDVLELAILEDESEPDTEDAPEEEDEEKEDDEDEGDTADTDQLVALAEMYMAVPPAAPHTGKVVLTVADLERPDSGPGHIRIPYTPGDPTRYVTEVWSRREMLRSQLEGGEWHDAEDIASASGQPLNIVEEFIEYSRKNGKFREYKPPQRRNKIVEGRRTGRVTEHFSPKFYAYALANLPRFRAALEEWQARQES